MDDLISRDEALSALDEIMMMTGLDKEKDKAYRLMSDENPFFDRACTAYNETVSKCQDVIEYKVPAATPTVYLVESGEYSTRSIEAVFSDREKALLYVALHDDCRILEYELDGVAIETDEKLQWEYEQKFYIKKSDCRDYVKDRLQELITML